MTKQNQLNLTSIVYTFILVLRYQHCSIGDNVIYGLLSKHLFQRKLKVTKSIYEKQCLPVSRKNERHSLKQFVFIRNTLEENFSGVLLFRVCRSFLFRQSKRLEVYFGLYKSALHFQGREDEVNTACEKFIQFFTNRCLV